MSKKTAKGDARRPFNHIFCVTIPRSGHHYFQNILSTYFGNELYYCEALDGGGCCMRAPCANSAGRLTLQKSHDPELAVPKTLKEALYVVQYREPASQLLSYMDWTSERSIAGFQKNDAAFLEWWTALHASKTIAFLKKWLDAAPKDAMPLEYTAFTADPAPHLRKLFERIGRPFDEARFDAVLESVAAIRAPGVKKPKGELEVYQPRDVTKSAILPEALVSAFDRVVRRNTPFIAWPASVIRGVPTAHFEDMVSIVSALNGLSGHNVTDDELVSAENWDNRFVRKDLQRWQRRQAESRA
ncbi:MAG: hypothetical protein JOZ72_18860 [Alphaproteobacteria bacterium]|nr:hypothetical protein [Alphaproteobacteria bacterium]